MAFKSRYIYQIFDHEFSFRTQKGTEIRDHKSYYELCVPEKGSHEGINTITPNQYKQM